MHTRQTRIITFSLFMALGWSGAVAAQPVDEASRASARTLGRAGIDAYRARDFAGAAEKLERAYRVVKVPALALWSARALEKTGKLVEASERFLEATRIPANSGDQATQEQARTDAVKEREALQPRIPTLMIEVRSGVDEIRIDGAVVPVDLLGVPRPVNPGSHSIVASHEGTEKSYQVTLKEAEKQTLKIDIPGDPGRSKLRMGGKANPLSHRSLSNDTPPEPKEGRTQRIIGYSALGLGGAGIVVGTVSGLLLVSKHNSTSVKDTCEGSRCPLGSEDTVNSFNTLRSVSTVGFIAGAIGVGAGVTLLLTVPKQPRQKASITPWIGVGSLGVNGGF